MKFLFLVFFALSVQASADFASDAQTVLNPPFKNEVFVPPGFDDLDDIEITYVNHSTSSCFLRTYAFVPDIDHKNKTIKISNVSLVLKSDFCRSRNTSSPTTLKIGSLEPGDYQLQFETEEGKYTPYSKINVSKSKTEQKDDYEYAPLDVNGLTVKVDIKSKNIVLNLPGSFPNGCYAFKEIKVLDERSETVIEVLPVVDMVTSICTQEIQFFNKEVKIPYNVSQRTKKLIHIRAADGVAINRVVTLE